MRLLPLLILDFKVLSSFKPRKAFSMIELVFVILIIGIIAAIAVPRQNATRQDAEYIALITNLEATIEDIKAYYAKGGELDGDVSPYLWCTEEMGPGGWTICKKNGRYIQFAASYTPIKPNWAQSNKEALERLRNNPNPDRYILEGGSALLMDLEDDGCFIQMSKWYIRETSGGPIKLGMSIRVDPSQYARPGSSVAVCKRVKEFTEKKYGLYTPPRTSQKFVMIWLSEGGVLGY